MPWVPEKTIKRGQKFSRKDLKKREDHLARVEASLGKADVEITNELRAKLGKMHGGHSELLERAIVMKKEGKTPAEIRAEINGLVDARLKMEQLPSTEQVGMMIKSEKK